MICKVCGAQLNDDAKFCTSCGSTVAAEPACQPAPAAQPFFQEAPASQPVYQAAPVAPAASVAPPQNEFNPDSLPPEYRPLSAWAYFGLTLLFSVPIVGFIFLIIFSFKRSNLNRRSFARSYWCALLVAAIVFAVILIICLCAGVGMASLFSNKYY